MKSIDDILTCFAHPHRREVVAILDELDDNSIPIEELSKRLATNTERGVDKAALRVRLHHVHLPKLEDAGVLEYDARSETIRYPDTPPIVADLIEICTAYE